MSKPMHPRKRLAKLIRNATLEINTIRYWNRINPTETPLDVEDFCVLRSLAIKCLAEKSQPEFERRLEELVAYAKTMEAP